MSLTVQSSWFLKDEISTPGARTSPSHLHQSDAATDEAVNCGSPTVFHEAWWLDAVTAGTWERAEVSDHGRVVGYLPYALQRRKGFNTSELPPFTYVLGPAISEKGGSGKTRVLRRMDIQVELAAQLPKVAHISHCCHPGISDLLGFQAAGFETFVQFSAELVPESEGRLWTGLSDKTRNVIRRANEKGLVGVLEDPQAFMHFYATNLAARGKSNYVDLERFPGIWEATIRRGCGTILVHRNSQGCLTAAAFFVWDHSRFWYVLSSRDPSRAGNGAMSLLLWEGIRQAGQRGLTFDFHGIATQGAARFFAGFGASIIPRLAFHRRSRFYTLFEALRGTVRGGEFRNFFVTP